MLLHIASDLHLERLGKEGTPASLLDKVQSDLLVLAGDIHRLERIAESFGNWPVPIIYVHGNHELYHRDYPAVISQAREQLASTDIHFLEEDEQVFGDIRFLGCCLWSDFALHGRAGPVMDYAQDYVPDHKIIVSHHERAFSPAYVRSIHRHSVAWLEHQLRRPSSGKTVVVTHYAPHQMSLGYRGASSSAPAFASDLGRLLGWADLWIHGHVHESCDYIWNGCRVVSNPAGYRRAERAVKATNRNFKRGFAIKI